MAQRGRERDAPAVLPAQAPQPAAELLLSDFLAKTAQINQSHGAGLTQQPASSTTRQRGRRARTARVLSEVLVCSITAWGSGRDAKHWVKF